MPPEAGESLGLTPREAEVLRFLSSGFSNKEVARRLAILDRYQAFTRGIVSLRDAVFFASFIGFWLFATTVLVDQRKAD